MLAVGPNRLHIHWVSGAFSCGKKSSRVLRLPAHPHLVLGWRMHISMSLRSIFWGVRQHRFLGSYRRFRTTYRPNLLGSSCPSMWLKGCPETSATYHQFEILNFPEQRGARSHGGGRLMSRKCMCFSYDSMELFTQPRVNLLIAVLLLTIQMWINIFARHYIIPVCIYRSKVRIVLKIQNQSPLTPPQSASIPPLVHACKLLT